MIVKQFCRGFAGALVLALAVACAPQGDDPESAADAFFAASVEQDIAAAYQLLASSYRAQLSPAQLQQFLLESGSDSFTAVSWARRDDGSNPGGARLLGTIETAGGGTEHVELFMIDEPAGWRVVAINVDPFGEQQASLPALPTAQQQAELVRSAMQLFWEGLESGSLSAFYQQTSATWQQQLSLADLEAAFTELLEAELDWREVAALEPVLVPANALDPQGKLVVGGVYPLAPTRLLFRQEYINESDNWRLLGLSVKFEDAVQ